MKTKGKIVILLLATSAALSAQNSAKLNEALSADPIYSGQPQIEPTEYFYPNRVSVYGTLGYENLMYQGSGSNSCGSFGYGGGVNYTRFFTKNWGLSLGLDYFRYSSTFDFTNRSSQWFNDLQGKRYRLEQYVEAKEKQVVGFLNVPVMANFRMPINKKWSFNAGLGLALNIPIHEKISVESGFVERTAYDPDNVIIFGGGNSWSDKNLSKHLGLGRYDASLPNEDSEKNFRCGAEVRAEVGTSYKISEKWTVDMGLYCNVGMLNVKKNSRDAVLETAYSGATTTNMVGRIHPITAGLKIGFSYNFAGKKPSRKAQMVTTDYNLLRRERRGEVRDSILYQERKAEIVDKFREILKESGCGDCNKGLSQYRNVDDRNIFYIFNYKYNDATLTNEQLAELDFVIRELKSKGINSITVTGHTDDAGSEQYNYDLGLRRAELVKRYIVVQGRMKPENITVTSKGRTQFLVTNASDDERALNRRVEITF